MKKVIKRETNKIAIFYDDLENKEIQSLILNSFEWVQKGYINDSETLFIKTGEYKISGSVKENKYTSVATNNWLVMDAMAVGNNKLLIDKIKVVNPEKFAEMYDIIDNEADLFSGLEEDEEDKSIKFENIKRKKA
ncbi:hypothetical protein GQX59_08535 [Brachyspira hyodysenteriae]|uniref:hypothetical protein n=1 Tax=Brachyspira hyodysenteriae TaxID=159 RepID=UPI001ADDD67B|nr:hypothetical protein [Brachyspira hyodysenteriae]QTM11473.1 hypothetical protein GQX59_08535 [Brachyspira hyodysenteriae]